MSRRAVRLTRRGQDVVCVLVTLGGAWLCGALLWMIVGPR